MKCEGIRMGRDEFEDDGRVVADMSDIELTPTLIPRFGGGSRSRSSSCDAAGGSAHRAARDNALAGGEEPGSSNARRPEPVYLDREERSAMIRGALSAALLVAGIIAAGFGIVIFIMTKIWLP